MVFDAYHRSVMVWKWKPVPVHEPRNGDLISVLVEKMGYSYHLVSNLLLLHVQFPVKGLARSYQLPLQQCFSLVTNDLIERVLDG